MASRRTSSPGNRGRRGSKQQTSTGTKTESSSVAAEQGRNRLASEKSPYLLQHKDNPVHWYAWGEEAFAAAQSSKKPIFLSIGYSTCHWCHVMAHESFESKVVAAQMNRQFINIKLDREERPDIDRVYMAFVQASTGHGGWPLSVWLTPDLKPIFGGTYFPRQQRYGQPSFTMVCDRVVEAWSKDAASVIKQGDNIMRALQSHHAAASAEPGSVSSSWQRQCIFQLSERYDEKLGGFGPAPKFPRPVEFAPLLSSAADDGFKPGDVDSHVMNMVEFTLTKMAMGGMYDHVGGGFHRYSVDKYWHVPHFEKMLYDQSQLVDTLISVYQLTQNQYYADVALDVLRYVSRDLTNKEHGVFYSAEDADSAFKASEPDKKGEGVFYVWTADELLAVLGPELAKIWSVIYGVKQGGNAPDGSDPHDEFVGQNILIQRMSFEDAAGKLGMTAQRVRSSIASARETLFAVREKRPRPHLDDKVITAWNGLMIGVEKLLWNPETRHLLRSWRLGPSTIDAFAVDYAFLIHGLLDLFDATQRRRWLDWAVQLQDRMNELFYDTENGGYYAESGTDDSVLLRMKETYDGAEPSENSVATGNLLRLTHLTPAAATADYTSRAKATLAASAELMERAPVAAPLLAAHAHRYLKPARQIIVYSPSHEAAQPLVRAVRRHHQPGTTLIVTTPDAVHHWVPVNPVFSSLALKDGLATVYVCENFTCQLPVTSVDELEKLLLSRRSS